MRGRSRTVVLLLAAAAVILVGINAAISGVPPVRCGLLTLISLSVVAGIYLITEKKRGPQFYAVTIIGLLGCAAFVILEWMGR